MCNLCVDVVNGVWGNFPVGRNFRTPDASRGKDFEIAHVEDDRIIIAPQNIIIYREAFVRAIHYLRVHNHDINNPCEVRSNNDYNLAGPLCRASREANQNVRCINYVLPILSILGIVGIDENRPNTTWLIIEMQ